MAESLLLQSSCVAVGDVALAIEGKPGSGKSSLALALIDRGAMLIGDDGVSLYREGDRLIASPPPNITGKLEIRGVGLVEMPVSQPRPLALILDLDGPSERMPDGPNYRDILGIEMPVLPFEPGAIAPAIRAEWALFSFGLITQ